MIIENRWNQQCWLISLVKTNGIEVQKPVVNPLAMVVLFQKMYLSCEAVRSQFRIRCLNFKLQGLCSYYYYYLYFSEHFQVQNSVHVSICTFYATIVHNHIHKNTYTHICCVSSRSAKFLVNPFRLRIYL